MHGNGLKLKEMRTYSKWSFLLKWAAHFKIYRKVEFEKTFDLRVIFIETNHLTMVCDPKSKSCWNQKQKEYDSKNRKEKREYYLKKCDKYNCYQNECVKNRNEADTDLRLTVIQGVEPTMDWKVNQCHLPHRMC